MSTSTVDGQSRVPPGFRFHPTEEELLSYYLRKKVAGDRIDLDVIRDVDLNKLEPWDIQETCRVGSTPQNDWYLFSHKDKKYPTGTRTNRATAAGFWKATGRDKVIYGAGCSKRIGMRKTLVFYTGRAPHGHKSDWIMHEYRLENEQQQLLLLLRQCDSTSQVPSMCSSTVEAAASAPEDGWVVCRVFKKKNPQRMLSSPLNDSSARKETTDAKTAQMLRYSRGDETLDQILQHLGRSCKQERDAGGPIRPPVLGDSTASAGAVNLGDWHLRHLRPSSGVARRHQERLMKLPALESPSLLALHGDICNPAPLGGLQPYSSQSSYPSDGPLLNLAKRSLLPREDTAVGDWVALDRLVATHLGASQPETSKAHLAGFLQEKEEEQQQAAGFGPCFSADASSLLAGATGQEYQQGDIGLWAFSPVVVGGQPIGPSQPPTHLRRLPETAAQSSTPSPYE